MILEACDDKKGYNFSVIDISKVSSVCDYFVICNGSSDRQTQAIAEEVEFKAEQAGCEVYHKEGMNTGRWILIDMGDIIVHVFHKDEREIYDLDTLWNEGEFIDSEEFGIKNWK
ncbi:ribosome silencing factor [Sedimentibacter sp. zth1]|nr:ribosome silencing factor [Sedimentibacter sp. zth1]